VAFRERKQVTANDQEKGESSEETRTKNITSTQAGAEVFDCGMGEQPKNQKQPLWGG